MTPAQDSQGRYVAPDETLTTGGTGTPTFEFSVTPVTANRDN